MDCDQERLPSDMIFEILSRTTSLETLDRCKVVCKDWKKMTYEPSFMPLYCRRTDNLSGYFIQDIKHNKTLAKFVSINQSGKVKEAAAADCIRSSHYDDITILASCNQGILCCEKRKLRSRRYYACKPATQQWQALPNPKLRYETAGVAIFVLRSTPLRYKIVRLSNGKCSRMSGLQCVLDYICEIFDSDTWSWRSVTQSLSVPVDDFIIESHPCVSIGDSIYWQTINDNVVMFQVSHEKFESFAMPEAVGNIDWLSKRLLEYEGRLGVSCTRKDQNMELWVMINANQWTKKMMVNMDDIQRNIDDYTYFLDFYNSQTGFMSTMFETVFYQLQDGTCTRVKLDGLNFAREVFHFRSNLEYVDLKGGK